MSRSQRLGLLAAAALTTLTLDIWSKHLAESYLADGSVVVLLPWVLELKLAYNVGIAFSLPLTGTPLIIVTLILMSILIIASILITLSKKENPAQKSEILGYGLIIGWGMGNAIERISAARVTDFLNVPFFANCNIADVGISLGVIILILASLHSSPLASLCHKR